MSIRRGTCANCAATVEVEMNRWVDVVEGGSYDWCDGSASRWHYVTPTAEVTA
jgi:hypothetical protein